MSDSDIQRLKEYVMPNGKYSNIRANSALIKKYFPTIYEEIKDDYKTKLYMLLHDIKEVPKCMNPACNNKVKLENIGAGFRKCCCIACVGQYQKTDLQFANKIKESKKNTFSKLYNERYNLDIESNNNDFIIKNYCKHGDLTINRNLFTKLKNTNSILCPKCSDEFIEKFIPTNEDFINERNNLNSLIKDNFYCIETNLKRYYPKIYKCIKVFSKKYVDTIWVEEYHMFLNNLKERPLCKFCGKHEVTYNYYLYFEYNNYCEDVNCKHKAKNITKPHREIYDFICNYIDKNDVEIDYAIKNEKTSTILKLDIFIKSLNLAFEYNGFYWHQDKRRSKEYHDNKNKLCNEHNISLMMIWEDEWKFKRPIVKSMILNKLHKNDNIIYARNCEIKEISSADNMLFCEQNHLQGKINALIKLGLFHNNELVSVMTFSNKRKWIDKSENKNQFELIRFCNKLNTSIVGGASKLFTHFLKAYKPNSVITYANCDISDGHLYKTLGFKEIGCEDISYWWVKDSIRHHRSNFMKHKLIEEGFDPAKTEDEIMRERGYMKVWGTGNLKYEYTNI